MQELEACDAIGKMGEESVRKRPLVDRKSKSTTVIEILAMIPDTCSMKFNDLQEDT